MISIKQAHDIPLNCDLLENTTPVFLATELIKKVKVNNLKVSLLYFLMKRIAH